MAKNKTKWVDIGTLRKNEKGTSYIVLDKNVELLVKSKENPDGVILDLGQYRQVKLVDPTSGLDSLLENGHIDQEKFDKQHAFLKEKNVRYKLSVPPTGE